MRDACSCSTRPPQQPALLTLLPSHPAPPSSQCSREYWGTDPAGVREISRACALEDEAASELGKAVPPGLQVGQAGGPRKCRAGALGFALHCLCMTVAHVQAVMVDCLPGTAVNSGLCASFSLACRPSWRRLCPGEGPRHPLPVSSWLDDITLRCTCTTCAAHPHPTHNCVDCCLPAPVHSHATPMPLSSQLPLPLRLACAARRGASRRADAGRAPHVTPPCWPATERRCGGPARHTARSRNGSD